MATNTSTVFSEYEVREIGFGFGGDEGTVRVPCIGSMEEEMEVKVVKKYCRGIAKKVRARGTGNGTIKITAHVPVSVFDKMYAMNVAGLKEGVKAYGSNSLHPEFTMTVNVFDEDDVEKLKAYPACMVQSNMSRKVENGAEEVAQLELEVTVMPDDDGNGLYEVIVGDLTDETVKESWMDSFTPDLVKAAS